MSQLADLCRPFPQHLIQDNPSGGGSYVPHPFYTQRLLLVLGGYRFELVEVLRGDVPGKAPNPQGSSTRAKEGVPALSDVIVGVICRLTVVVDGQTMVIEDAGDVESPHNWPHDGARSKDGMSDALKRCCARLGLGLHLYMKHQADFVLRDQLLVRERDNEVADSHEPRPQFVERPVTAAADPTLLDEDPGRPFTEP